MLTLALTLLVGVLAGGLGALLGVGGGVVLVPLIHAVLGRSFREAAAVSLVAVLATSASVAASTETRKLLNVRLALVLLIFSVSGATFGASVLHLLSEQTYERIFGITAAVIAVGMLQRLDKRNVRSASAVVDPGVLGGHFYDEDTRTEVYYHPRRLPIAMFASFGAGLLASFLGIGGGILVVPSLNSWCGVPMRVAAATSGFMIGITAIPGAIMHYHLGYLTDFRLAAAAALGVLIGYRLGISLGQRTPVRGLKILMAVMLAIVALRYLI
ncbi:MAG TPA: sulfite exporter TauE/SafE family protein [Vicinamibacterales bacterium]|nr:sulfite exporter TauE/SafE family protein [Vicinamibacterales bacterium]